MHLLHKKKVKFLVNCAMLMGNSQCQPEIPMIGGQGTCKKENLF